MVGDLTYAIGLIGVLYPFNQSLDFLFITKVFLIIFGRLIGRGIQPLLPNALKGVKIIAASTS